MEEKVGRLSHDALRVEVGAGQLEADLEGLLHDLSLDQLGVVEQLRGVRSRRTLSPTLAEDLLELLDRACHPPYLRRSPTLVSSITWSPWAGASDGEAGTTQETCSP